MTDTPAPRAHPPGWYADPMGSPRQRWWDGTRWTDELHDPAAHDVARNEGARPDPGLHRPALEVNGVLAPPALGPTTAVYNPLIWAIAVLPVLTLIASSAVDLTAQMQMVLDETGAPLSPEEVTSNLVSFSVYAATIVFAFFDRRALLQLGVTKPFHWAWAILWSGAYVFGRSVIVRRRTGRGMAPAWVWLGIFVVSLVSSVSRMSDAVNTVFPNGSVPT